MSSLDDIIQSNTGTANGTSTNATLPSGTLDGSTVIVCVMTFGGSFLMSGFTRDNSPSVGSAKGYIMRKSNVTAGETTFAITNIAVPQPIIWFAMEIVGLHRTAAYETRSTTYSAQVGVTSVATDSTPQTTNYDGLAIAFHSGQNISNSTVPTWSGQTGDFVEILETSRVDGSTATSGAVSVRPIYDIDTYQSTATSSVTVTAGSVVLVYAAAGSHRQPNVDLMCGFEMGTAAGHKTGNTANPPVDASAGSVSVVTTSPRTGAYCLELTGSAAAASVSWTTTGALSLYPAPSADYIVYQQYVKRVSFCIAGSLPGADVTVCALDTGTGSSGSGVQVVYRTASQKLGVQVHRAAVGVGTEVLSATTVAADTWYDLDIIIDMANEDRGSLWWAKWSLDGVEQTMASFTTGSPTASATISQVRLGWLSSSTATIRYDDVVGSKHPGHYPLGDVRIYPLAVDPAGTVTISGTSGNFQTFTANGTMAAWNATTARGAVDEIPPTISASADGVAQITTAASDYMAFPMETRAAATNLECIRAVRWYFPGWAASASAAPLGFRAWDGTVETLLFAAADPNFDNSTSTPAWVCRMHRDLGSAVPYVWTQAGLDALAARIGFGTGAVDVGVHAILAEVAIRAAVETQVLEQDGVFIYAGLDPDTSNVVYMRLDSTAVSLDAWATYTINGSDVNRTATAANSYNDLYVVGAESNSAASFVTGGLS